MWKPGVGVGGGDAVCNSVTYVFCSLCWNSNYTLWSSRCQNGVFLLLIVQQTGSPFLPCTLNIRVPRLQLSFEFQKKKKKNFNERIPCPRNHKILLNLEMGKLKVVKLKESDHLNFFTNCRL